MPKDNEVDEKVMPDSVARATVKLLPFVTVEQVSRYRAESLRVEAERDSLAATVAELRAEVERLRAALHIETHKVITCGVAASHPDASLSRRMEYAGKWDSPQAQDVRKLRDRADAAERRVGELEANDRRYRFLRRKLCVTGNGDGTCAMQAINLPHRIHGWPEHGEHEQFFDAAIDSYLTGADPT